jgi:uncharacterized protein YbjT (DUF2867 family)
MRVLVLGGTGTVGARLTALLRARGVDAIPAARRAPPGGIALDLADVAAITEAARGCAAAYLTTSLGPEETALGLGAVDALRRAGVPRVAYLAIHNLDAMAEIPHFASKQPIVAALRRMPGSIVLAPNFFQENDVLFADAIRFGGVYPLPVGRAGIWSVAADDIAEAAANALTTPDWAGMTVPLCGPEALTGAALAANWAQALGGPVHYAGDAIQPFLGGLERAMPLSDWLRDDFRIMMEVTQARGCPASDADRAATQRILGRQPRAHAEFATAAARHWAAQQEEAA